MTSLKEKPVKAKAAASKWPKVNVGSHLTVYTHEDGRTDLVWNDEALLNDVKAAILKAESTIPVETPKRKTKKA